MAEEVQIREVTPVPPRADACPQGCKDKFGQPRIMKRLANQSPRARKQADGSLKQVTVMVRVSTCDKCGHQVRTEEDL